MGKMVAIWREGSPANTAVSQELPIASLILSLSVWEKPVNLSSPDTLSVFALPLPPRLIPHVYLQQKTSRPDLMQSSAYLRLSVRPHPFILSSALPFIAGFCRYPRLDPTHAISRSLLCHSQLQICSSPTYTHTHTRAQLCK